MATPLDAMRVDRALACTYVREDVYDAMRSPNVGECARAAAAYADARATAALCTPAVPVYASLLPYVAGADEPDGGVPRVRSSFDALAEAYVLLDTLRSLVRVVAESGRETACVVANYSEVCARRTARFARDLEALVPAHVAALRGGALQPGDALSLAESAALREVMRCYTLDVLHALEYTVATLLDVPRERRRDLLTPRDDPLAAPGGALAAEAVLLLATCAEQSVRGAKARLSMYELAFGGDGGDDGVTAAALARHVDDTDPLAAMLAYIFFKNGSAAAAK